MKTPSQPPLIEMPQTSSYRLTPMFEQYLSVKEQCPDALLFYRMGDFYELFFDDAVVAARELQLALTSRNKNPESAVPMCGIPWHALEPYASQLVAKGYNLAICDQVEKAGEGKLVRREITKIITPGTVLDEANLHAGEHTYLGALFGDGKKAGFVWADVSTGQWSGVETDSALIWQWVLKLAPAELLLCENEPLPKNTSTGSMALVRRQKPEFDEKRAMEALCAAQQVESLSALGLASSPMLVRACGALLGYLARTQKRSPDHMLPFRPLDIGSRLSIDDVTEKNLEIFARLNGARGKGTLRHCMDETVTPMGGRFLEETLHAPFRDIGDIEERLDAVEFFFKDDKARRRLREALKNVFDLERISTKIHLNRALPKDFLSLRNSLAALPLVKAALEGEALPLAVQKLLRNWEGFEAELEVLEKALVDPAPTLITEGGIFKSGYDANLDALLELSEHGDAKLTELFERDQRRANMRLKLGNNRVFGYYYEITKGQQTSPLPSDFMRRQTLANAERYTTPELKELEEKISSAAQERMALEYSLFQELRQKMALLRPRLLAAASRIASLDLWQSFAEKARQNAWVRPVMKEAPSLRIQEGRHPIIEESCGRTNFVPNSIILDERRRFCLLTGPNMAGKSTILRQSAIICLMAQAGSFVPAGAAEIGVVDKIFSRVGASDNIAQGQSTFMVEMMETARILRQSTKRSLVILDEIGRGTSTYDGLSLAWAVSEELSQRFAGSIRTLFATHYHELTQLEGQIPGVFTMNIAVREHGGDVIFLHKLLPGPADRSYGVEVAKLAGVPRHVVSRAKELLERFETLRDASKKTVRAMVPDLLPGLTLPPKKEKKKEGRLQADPGAETVAPPRNHPLVEALKDLNPDDLTPMAALKLICEWKKIWGEESNEATEPPLSEE